MCWFSWNHQHSSFLIGCREKLLPISLLKLRRKWSTSLFHFVYFPSSSTSTKKNKQIVIPDLDLPKWFLRCEELYGNCCNLDENIKKPPDFPETISSTVIANLVPAQNQTLQRKQLARTDQSHSMIWGVTLSNTFTSSTHT